MVITKKSKLTDAYNKYRPLLRNFFEGKLYPFTVALAVLLGHITALELYFGIAVLLAASLALVVCDTIKPFLPTLLTFVYFVNLKHTPGVPNWSDYYTRLYVLIPVICCFIILAAAAGFFVVKNIVPVFKFKTAPLFTPLVILSAAFLLNGAFSSGWKFASLVFGFAEVAVFFLLFYLLYYGIKNEDPIKLFDYVTYLSLLIAMVLVGEVVFLFLTNDRLISEAGSIVKEEVLFGWAACNPMGFSLAVIIPLLMRGAMTSKYSLVYLGAAIVTWVSMVLTMSRNALIFGTLGLGISFLIGAFFGPRKRRTLFRIVLAVGAAAALFGTLILWNKISAVLADFLSRGFSDNGRFTLWKNSFDNFLKSPIFGRGFFDWGEMDVYESATFVPTMSHNTFFQLISSMGIFGTLAYGYYRVKTVAPFIKKFSFDKAMLLLPILVTLGASLLDNFIFYFYTAFLYILLLAIAFRMREREEGSEKAPDASANE